MWQHTPMAKKRFKSSACPNCGTHYADVSKHASFCPGCGQENHDLNVPLRHLLEEAAESVFHFDTKSFRTATALAFRPGFLTAEFLRGRRARYVMPVRLYVFVSFLFFLVLALPAGRHATGGADREAPQRSSLNMSVFGIRSTELRDVQDSDLDALMRSRGVQVTRLNKHILQQWAPVGRGEQAELRHLLLRCVSYMMFALMPFFGFLLFLFFHKSEPRYVGSLVFSLHYHSFAFLLLAALSLLSRIPMLGLWVLLAPAVLAVYLCLALRSVYRRRWPATVLATVALGLLHLVSLVLLLWAAVMVGILLF
jgi:hypothetical protein